MISSFYTNFDGREQKEVLKEGKTLRKKKGMGFSAVIKTEENFDETPKKVRFSLRKPKKLFQQSFSGFCNKINSLSCSLGIDFVEFVALF